MTETAMDDKAVAEMRIEAIRLKKELEDYLDDLELFSKPDFWEAVRQKPSKKYASVDEYFNEKGFQ